MYPVHKGVTYVEVSGRILHYCSSKCRKNVTLGRDSKKVLWVTKKQEGQK
jgi:ribosomal protein L24E